MKKTAVESVTRYAITDDNGKVKAEPCEFIKRGKGWRAAKRVWAFKFHSDYSELPGEATPREAVEAWIKRKEEAVADLLDAIGAGRAYLEGLEP